MENINYLVLIVYHFISALSVEMGKNINRVCKALNESEFVYIDRVCKAVNESDFVYI